jgi:beta-galactosidase
MPGDELGVFSRPSSFEAFASHERHAFNGLTLVIVGAKPGQTGNLTVRAKSNRLKDAVVRLKSQSKNRRLQ